MRKDPVMSARTRDVVNSPADARRGVKGAQGTSLFEQRGCDANNCSQFLLYLIVLSSTKMEL